MSEIKEKIFSVMSERATELGTKVSGIDEFIDECEGCYFRLSKLPGVGDMLAQHRHAVDHATLIPAGAAKLWINEKLDREYVAPAVVSVKAGNWHRFEATQPNTIIVCVFNVLDPRVVEMMKED